MEYTKFGRLKNLGKISLVTFLSPFLLYGAAYAQSKSTNPLGKFGINPPTKRIEVSYEEKDKWGILDKSKFIPKDSQIYLIQEGKDFEYVAVNLKDWEKGTVKYIALGKSKESILLPLSQEEKNRTKEGKISVQILGLNKELDKIKTSIDSRYFVGTTRKVLNAIYFTEHEELESKIKKYERTIKNQKEAIKEMAINFKTFVDEQKEKIANLESKVEELKPKKEELEKLYNITDATSFQEAEEKILGLKDAIKLVEKKAEEAEKRADEAEEKAGGYKLWGIAGTILGVVGGILGSRYIPKLFKKKEYGTGNPNSNNPKIKKKL